MKRIALALREVCPNLGEAGGDEANPTVLSASFCAYAADRDLETVEQWTALLLEVLGDFSVVLDDEDNEGAAQRVVELIAKKGILKPTAPKLMVGDLVMAVLSEDHEWHPAMVCETVTEDVFKIIFSEYGKPQDVAGADLRKMDEIVDDEETDGQLKEGECDMCKQRKLLTFHHLIPKDTHPTYLKKRLPPGVEGENPPSRQWLNSYGTMVCKKCHSYIHSLAPNTVLAVELNTLEKILEDPRVQRRIEWLAKK